MSLTVVDDAVLCVFTDPSNNVAYCVSADGLDWSDSENFPDAQTLTPLPSSPSTGPPS